MPDPLLAVPPPDPLDTSRLQTLETDAHCVGCSYNLRGLSERGLCPECGTPVALSLGGSRLRNAARGYLSTLSRGIVWIISGTIICSALAAVGFFFWRTTVGLLSAAGVSLGWLAMTAVLCWGYWQLTVPNPQGEHQGGSVGSRRFTRMAICVWAFIQVVQTLFALAPASAGLAGTSLAAHLGRSGLVFLQVPTLLAIFFGTFRHLGNLARRIPNIELIRRIETFMWVLPLLCTVGILACLAGPVVAIVLYVLLLVELRRHILLAIDWQTSAGYAHSAPSDAGNRVHM